jgi:putative sigma-54 modulation protein
MSFQLDFRKIDATDALKAKIEKRTDKFRKFVTYPMDIHVMLSLEKLLHCAEITCHAEHRVMVAVAKTKDLYESIDLAAQKIESQLRKEREKHKGHKLAHKLSSGKGAKLATDVGAVLPHLEKRPAARARKTRSEP